MSEIKHTFQGGKMNKDLDERLVPNGEYRDAMNVQVRTTDADGNDGVGDAGTVQNIKGNQLIGSAHNEKPYLSTVIPNKVSVIGGVANEKNNTAYFLVAGLDLEKVLVDYKAINSQKIFIDTIVEVNTDTNVASPVLVDRYAITNGTKEVFGTIGPPQGTFQVMPVPDGSIYRIGMKIRALDFDGVNLLSSGAEIQNIDGNDLILYEEQSAVAWANSGSMSFVAPRVLNFDQNNKVTGINVIDDLLFWTDGKSKTEPKKINITKCKEGTVDFTSHTQLRLANAVDNDILQDYIPTSEMSLAPSANNDIKEEHITVKRKAPTMAPNLKMSRSTREGITTIFSLEFNFTTAGGSGDNIEPGEQITIEDSLFSDILSTWEVNDILTFKEEISADSAFITATIDSPPTEDSITITILSISTELLPPNEGVDGSGLWTVTMEQKKPLFELKFARFGYRYKYDDGEYSSFSPWSELAFLPGHFDYHHRKGFNLGMVNQLRELTITDFIPHQRTRGPQVSSVDILYKTTLSPNVYTVKTITRGLDPEWDLFTPSVFNSNMVFGEMKITSEMIHNVVEKNQLLRAWDNVPRFAIAQEIAANRVVYANYTQGYNITKPVKLIQNLLNYELPTPIAPTKSIKSIRDYKFGMVFGDKYGRESPVIAPGYIKGDNPEELTLLSGETNIEKQFSKMKNTFELKQEWNNDISSSTPERWMDYVKYYIKETSNEYYNLVLDRWYDAEDGNVWLSFPSADRNKVDEETYLILKNEHGNNIAVLEAARYKIIAIKNEAPDFIKLDPRYMGEVEIDDTTLQDWFFSGSFNVDTTSPTKLMGPTRQMIISESNWQDFLAGYSTGQSKGTLKIRVKGKNGTGTELTNDKWTTVTYSNQLTLGNGVIRWQEDFGEGADMVDRFTAAGETVSGLTYSIEFQENVVENQAEFDGRFFVKIAKDDILQESVLKNTGISSDFDSVSSIRLGYIDSQKNNPGEYGPRVNYEWNKGTDDGNTGAAQVGEDGDGNTAGANVAPTKPNSDLGDPDEASKMALGCWSFPGSSYGDKTRNFWNRIKGTEFGFTNTKMFIDSAMTRRLHMNGSIGGNMDFEDSLTSPEYYKPTGLDQGILGGAYTTVDYPDVLPTEDGHFGRIAISMMPWYASNEPDTMDNPSEMWSFQNSANIFEFDFKNKMTTQGTYFKFDDDPDGIMYMIINKPGEFDEWGVNSNDVANYARSPSQYGGSNNSNNNDANSNGFAETLQSSDYDFAENGDNDWGSSVTIDGNAASSGGSFSNQTLVPWIEWAGWVSGNNPNPNYGGILPLYGGTYTPNGYNTDGSSDDDECIHCHHAQNEVLDPFCRRSGFRVEFRKCNADGTLAGNGSLGIDLDLGFDPRGQICHDGRESLNISIVERSYTTSTPIVPTDNGAVWETEPKEDVGLDLYYEASNAIPLFLTSENTLDFVPYESKVTLKDSNLNNVVLNSAYINHHVEHVGYTEDTSIIAIHSTDPAEPDPEDNTGLHNINGEMNIGQVLVFEHKNGTKTMSAITNFMIPVEFDADNNPVSLSSIDNTSESVFQVTSTKTGYYEIETEVYQYPVELSWFNCYSFGNGVESDRIRDDFNAPTIDNGVKLSTTFLQFGEEQKGSGLIYSGIYNSISGVNNLNEFNQSEKITKDLNPSYGSIQALKTRDTDVIAFAEDKVLKITTNKDALFNADGNPQLLASNRVLGTAIPFAGDYGISKNPESLSSDNFRMYFADMQRGAVIRLSGNGITPVSNVGMKTWFRDNLKKTKSLQGTFDSVNGEYNLTLDYKEKEKDTTISFNEGSKGWVSFKSFVPEAGVSVGGKYITAKDSSLWEHGIDILDSTADSQTFGQVINRNTFYDTFTESSINVIFNDLPGSVKCFRTINYEGSQAKIDQFIETDSNDPQQPDGTPFIGVTDDEYYNLTSEDGWYVDLITTNLSSKGSVFEFKDKEGKWFNKIDGDARGTITDQDLNEFSVQGLGIMSATDEEEEIIEDIIIEPTTVTVQLNSDMVDDSDNDNVEDNDGNVDGNTTILTP